MNTQEFLQNLAQHPDKGLVFECDAGQRVAPGYHVTEFMPVKKFLSIYERVAASVAVEGGAEVRFEYGNPARPTVYYHVGWLEVEGDKLVVRLTPPGVTSRPPTAPGRRAAAEPPECGITRPWSCSCAEPPKPACPPTPPRGRCAAATASARWAFTSSAAGSRW